MIVQFLAEIGNNRIIKKKLFEMLQNILLAGIFDIGEWYRALAESADLKMLFLFKQRMFIERLNERAFNDDRRAVFIVWGAG